MFPGRLIQAATQSLHDRTGVGPQGQAKWLYRISAAFMAMALASGLAAGHMPAMHGPVDIFLMVVGLCLLKSALEQRLQRLVYFKLAERAFGAWILTLIFGFFVMEAVAWMRTPPGSPGLVFLSFIMAAAMSSAKEARHAERRDQNCISQGDLVQPRETFRHVFHFILGLLFAGCACVADLRCYLLGQSMVLFSLILVALVALLLGSMAACAIPRPPRRRRAHQARWSRAMATAQG